MGKDNQKTILKIVKEPCDKDHIFICVNKEASFRAAKELGPPAFLLWLYFASNSTEYKNWDLSSAHVEETVGLSRGVYNRAIQKLIDNRYLIPHENKQNEVANEWIFYEAPPASERQRNNPCGVPLYENNTSLDSKYYNPCRTAKQDLKQNESTNNTYNTSQNNQNTDIGRRPSPLKAAAAPLQKKKVNEAYSAASNFDSLLEQIIRASEASEERYRK